MTRRGFTSGVRWGETLGSPITLVVENRDWKNWQRKMSADPADRDDSIASRARDRATPISSAR